MYKVVLVDDDVFVTQFLEKMILWEEYGFQVVKTFKDGLAAYDYLKEHDYDVLITDIGMPKLNGIELVTQLEKEPSYKIILSCHDDFHYVQQALKLGVFDYLLKESMDENEISILLQKLKTKMDQDLQMQQKQVQKDVFLKQNMMALKTVFIEKLMEEASIPDETWWTQQEELLHIDFSRQKYQLAVCFIDGYRDVVGRYQKEILLQFSIHNLIEEILRQYHSDVQIFFLQDKFLILFPSCRQFEEALREMQNAIQQYLKISITIIKKSKSNQDEHLVESIKLLLNDEEIRFYQPHGTMKNWESIMYQENAVFQDYPSTLHELRLMVINKEEDQVRKYLQTCLSDFKKNYDSPPDVRGWAIKLVLDIRLYVGTHMLSENNESLGMIDQVIRNIKTLEQLESILNKVFGELIHQIETRENVADNKYIQQAKTYVRSKVHEKISLGDMAAYLHLNASYFSRIFKRETGESFIEFVTKVKMEEAKELLDYTNRSIDDISEELGFTSKSYFVKTFHKQFGVTPKAYKDKASL